MPPSRSSSTASSSTASDPRVLRAIAHPARSRILDELQAAGPMRAADLSALLGIPANQASFHLRQLAKYGLIVEAPEVARDARDRVWRAVSDDALNLDLATLAEAPGGQAAVSVFKRHWLARAHASLERAIDADLRREHDTTTTFVSSTLRLTTAEARALATEIERIVAARERRGTRGEQSARSYEFLMVLQPAEDL